MVFVHFLQDSLAEKVARLPRGEKRGCKTPSRRKARASREEVRTCRCYAGFEIQFMTRRDGALVSLGLVMLAVCCEPAYPRQNDAGVRRLPGCTWMQKSIIVRTSLVLGLRHRWYGGRGSEDEDSDFVTGGFGPHHDCSNHAGKPCRDSDMLLWRSAFQGEVNATKQALRDGAAVNARNQYDSMRAALHYAVSNRNMSCAHCNQDTSDVDPACKCRALIISELLKAGADPLLPCALGARAIHLAAATGAMRAVKVLVQAGVDIGITDHSRRKPLHYAAVRWLVRQFVVNLCIYQNAFLTT